MEFTTTEYKLLRILSDGLPHRREELFECLPDELGPMRNVRRHLYNIRKKIERKGEDILCVFVERRICYRLVRLINKRE